MSDLKYRFTSKELEDKGFKTVTDGGSTYLEYVLYPFHYWSSPFLATNSIDSLDWVLYSNQEWLVINPKNVEGEDYLTENEIDDYIEQSKL